ncbi:MAG: cell division protein SepF [Firmicutes bacterium]|nr:cell division protein SepF [Bacillota bacterium]
MGFGDTMKKLIGIDDDDNYDDIDITQEEIDLERKRIMKAEAPSSPAPRAIDEPMSTGISQRADNPYNIVEPMMNAKPVERRASMNGSGPFKMVVIEPKHFDECSKLVDNLKARKPIIINLEKVETDLARKMFDFLSGATYALSGNVQRVTQNIFIFAPANVDINAKLNRDNTEAGYVNNNNNNPWR